MDILKEIGGRFDCTFSRKNYSKQSPMYQTFTDHDLIRFMYQETTAEETRSIKEALLVDEALAARLRSMRQVHNFLGKGRRSPSDTSIRIIMEQSRSMGRKLETSW